MATCVVEGIDPVRMCRGLVDKMAESEQLKSEADPGVLVLFQDWLERLEEEAVETVKRTGSLNPVRLADELGLSESGGIPRRTAQEEGQVVRNGEPTGGSIDGSRIFLDARNVDIPCDYADYNDYLLTDSGLFDLRTRRIQTAMAGPGKFV
jgi:hypothetical protein